MNDIADLHIEKELLPLFDYTLHEYSKIIVLDILRRPLLSIEEVKLRQDLLKGFISNNDILKNYFYSVSYLKEVYNFLTNAKLENLSNRKLRYRFLTLKKDKSELKSKLTQLLLLFHRIHTIYISRLDIKVFPEFYKIKLLRLNGFLSSLNLTFHEELIREYRLKDKHIIELSALLVRKKKNGEISIFWEDLFEFEAFHSIGLSIIEYGFSFPEFSEKGLKLNNFYHPVLDNPVINSFETTSNVIVLTGPNMSGKSTILKAVSICVYLGQLGIAVPASNVKMPFFKGISVFINHRDDILNGYSHFMNEIMNLKKVVEEISKGKKHFAVFDELFSGTNAEDAHEICTTTINGLSKFKNSIFFISTHLEKLKGINAFKKDNVDAYFIDCQLRNKNPIFTYELKKGWSEIKVGRILFNNEGLNEMLN